MSHAKLPPSGQWMHCAQWQSDPSPSRFADEGTDAHQLAAQALLNQKEARDLVGQVMDRGHAVDADMAVHVDRYVQNVLELNYLDEGLTYPTHIEKRLAIEGITGEQDAHGTADCVILRDDELIVVDLKYGQGVPVDAKDNPQLQIYGLAALDEFGLAYDFDRVRLVISQPRLNSVTEDVLTVDELEALRPKFQAAADRARDPNSPATPGDKQCRWCAKKGTCPALMAEAMADFEVVEPEKADDDDLARVLAKIDLLEIFIGAVKAEANRRLTLGINVPGWKLVNGKRGARQWVSAADAEKELRAMRLRLEQLYDYHLISPTGAERLFKADVLGPKQWARLQALIAYPEGKPTVVRESDKRPALVMSAAVSDFDDMATTPTHP